MSDTQSIIVYRNPLEKAIWEGDVSILPIIVWMIVTVGLIVLIHSVIESQWFRKNVSRKLQNNNIVTYVSIAVSALIGAYVGSLFVI